MSGTVVVPAVYWQQRVAAAGRVAAKLSKVRPHFDIRTHVSAHELEPGTTNSIISVVDFALFIEFSILGSAEACFGELDE